MSVPSTPFASFLTSEDFSKLGKNSLRFNRELSTYAYKVFTQVGNRLTMTFNCWIKRSKLNEISTLFSTSTQVGDDFNAIEFNAAGQLTLNSNGVILFRTTNVYNDTTNHYNINIQLDSTQSDVNNRVIIYVNGIYQPLNINSITQNYTFPFNRNIAHYLCRRSSNMITGQNDGYLSFVRFIDGYSIPFDKLCRIKKSTGLALPRKYSGNYGTNGFFLDFKDENFIES